MELKLVSFELAKELKELGFDAGRTEYYMPSGYIWVYYGSVAQIPEEAIKAPTLELAKMWFRVKHNMSAECQVGDNKWAWEMYGIDNDMIDEYTLCDFTSYEEALEAALLKCCEILKERKS